MATKARIPEPILKSHARFSVGGSGEKENGNQSENASTAGQSNNEIMGLFVESVCQGHQVVIKKLMENLEKRIIQRTLVGVSGNLKEAARILGIKYTTLYEKVKRYDIRFKRILDEDSWPPFPSPPSRPGDSSF